MASILMGEWDREYDQAEPVLDAKVDLKKERIEWGRLKYPWMVS